jgi:hypothetical protein
MRIFHPLLFGLATLMPVVSYGQAKCPWLNEATARGILGGPVTATASISQRGEGVCEFSRQQGAAVHQLRVSVNLINDIPKQFPTYLAQCPPKSTSLRAIGNEAVTCAIEGKADRYGQRIVGRVRDQAFVVTITSSAQNDPSLPQDACRDKANLTAEQIAGILF